MAPWTKLLWYLFLLALAAALLAVDLRFFLFYAFMVLLMLLYQVDYLRAMLRVYWTADDVRSILLMRHANVTDAETQALAKQMHEDLRRHIQKSLDRDIRLVFAGGGRLPHEPYLWLTGPRAER